MSAVDSANWSPAGPPTSDSTVIANAGTLLLPTDVNLVGNAVYLESTTLVFVGDTLTTELNPTLDSATSISTNVAGIEPAPRAAQQTVIDDFGIFINDGTIEAGGPAGSTFTLSVAGTTIGGTMVPGVLINYGLIRVDAGNTMTIAVAGTSELFDVGTVTVNGGTLNYTATSFAAPPPPYSGTAQVLVENDGTLTQQTNASIGAAAGDPGAATVEAGGLWNVGFSGVAFLAVGSAAAGSLSVLSGGTVEVGTGGVGIATQSGVTGTVTVSGAGSKLVTTGGMNVGKAGQGALSIVNGGTVEMAGVSGITVGNSLNSSGNVVISGTDAISHASALLTYDTGSKGITVGGDGNGTLTVGAGGTIDMKGTGGILVGQSLGIVGSVSVSGLGALINEGTAANGMTIGQSGTGFLSVNNGGSVSIAARGLAIGSATGGTGTVVVGSGGGISLTGTSGAINLGSGGTGLLDIESGGLVTTDGGVFIASSGTGGVGILAVTGGSLTDNGAFTVGGTGTGTLTLTGGGRLMQSGTYGVGIGLNAGSQGTVLVNGGTLLTIGGGHLDIGNAGTGSLDITGSIGSYGSVYAGGGIISVGNQSGGRGRLTIENGGLAGGSLWVANVLTGTATGFVEVGSGGLLQVNSVTEGGGGTIVVDGGSISSAGIITIGQGGTGASLTLGSGSITTNGLQIGQATAANGSGTVTISSGLLTSNSPVTVGNSGNGWLTINTGGSLNATDGVSIGALGLDGHGTLIIDGGTLTDSGQLAIGTGGTAVVTVEASGMLAVTASFALDIGSSSGGTAELVVSGGTFTTTGAPLFIGNGGNASMLVENAGTVITASNLAGPTVDINASGSAQASVTVDGTASVWQITDATTGGQFIVGDNASGSLTVSNGALVDAGTLTVDIGNQSGGSGTVIVTGATLAGGRLDIANAPTSGLLTIGAGGTVAVASLDLGVGGTLELAGGTLSASLSLSQSSGLIDGYGTLGTQINTSGTVVAGGGTLDVTGGLIGTGAITIDGGAALQVDGLLGNSLSVTFATSPGSEALILGAPNVGDNSFALDNWQNGDEIAFSNGVTVTGAQWLGGGTLAVATSAGTYDFTNVSLAAGTFPTFATATNFVELISCFAEGTRIRTLSGEMPVELLAEGDKVCTGLGNGAVPVIWIGHRRVNCATHPAPHRVWPVRVRAGAFGPGLPVRDLVLSPDHALYLNNVLIPVKRLVNGRNIVQEPVSSVTYYHVELSAHDVLFAEGLAAESYLDVGDRSNFANGGETVRLHVDFTATWEVVGCAPLLVVGPKVEEVRAMLMARAEGLVRATA